MIVNEVQKSLEKMMTYYSLKDEGKFLSHAKKKYFLLAGEVDYDTQDFEHKMNSFTEWFLLHYLPYRSGMRMYQKYAIDIGLDNRVYEILSSMTYSVFEPLEDTKDGISLLWDCINHKKIQLKAEHNSILVIKGELFVGRILHSAEGSFLLKGMVPMPNEVTDWIKKQCLLVKKKKISYTQEEFCLALEEMKYKTVLYQHIKPEKLFNLEY